MTKVRSVPIQLEATIVPAMMVIREMALSVSVNIKSYNVYYVNGFIESHCSKGITQGGIVLTMNSKDTDTF